MRFISRGALGALVAVFAMSLVAVSAAPAFAESPEQFEFTGGVGTAWTATQESTQVITVEGFYTECKELKLEGTVPAGKATATAEAGFTLGNCKAYGLTTTVKNTNCEYRFGEPTDSEAEEQDKLHSGGVQIIKGPKTEECKIVMTNGKCKVTIREQNLGNGLAYKNLTDLHVDAEFEHFAYEQTASCVKGAGKFTNGKYVGLMNAVGVKIN